ncbi:MAG: 50S ribosomal protein L29 [Candidatus Pacebacteria bacterium]|nr:50S ribosomal protein L29 [Candidatus Paceibacterota bacterium]
MATTKQGEKIKEFLRLDQVALEATILDYKEKLRNFHFDLSAGKVKDVRAIREVKKDIARLETFLNSKKVK